MEGVVGAQVKNKHTCLKIICFEYFVLTVLSLSSMIFDFCFVFIFCSLLLKSLTSLFQSLYLRDNATLGLFDFITCLRQSNKS